LLEQLQHLPHHHQQHNPHPRTGDGGHGIVSSSSEHNDHHHHHHVFDSLKQTVARWRHGSSADSDSSVTEAHPHQGKEDNPASDGTVDTYDSSQEEDSTDSSQEEERTTRKREGADTVAAAGGVPGSLIRRVSFGHCEIRSYEQVVGDHPSCSVGCPIQLGWSYTEESSVRVDEHETTAAASRGSSGTSLRLTPEERIAMLSASLSLSERDLLRECRRLNRAERSRRLNEKNAKVFFSSNSSGQRSAARKSPITRFRAPEGEESSTPRDGDGPALTDKEEIVME